MGTSYQGSSRRNPPLISQITQIFPKETTSFDILQEAYLPKDIIVDGTSNDARAYAVTTAQYGVAKNGQKCLEIHAA
ncbi:hypothetical protein BBP40_009068 [Aspergillus hancockii]|nr:hypothetical protein BBP40_009068 [Aspergillus hancockii]